MEFEQSKEEDEDQEHLYRELPVDEEEDLEEEGQFISNKNTTQIASSSSREQLYSSFCGPSAAGKRWPDLSLRTGGGGGGGGEREHMFDKVVTPSDVGKLNRLVIPKQHAEKYFPLESSSSSSSPDPKGLLLNFEDGAGKSWRFRYSYWNSSQSYVMTKGWSRFVKDKKLDPGDVVSFLRDPSNTSRLFIDWRRRPSAAVFHHRWSPAISYPPPPPHHYLAAMPHHHHHPSYIQNNYHHRFHHHPYQYDSFGSFQLPARVIESSSAVAAAAAAAPKRLRLFGVNMEYSPCQEEEDEEDGHDHHQVRLPNNNSNNNRNISSPVVYPIMPLQSTTPSGGGGGGGGSGSESRGFPAQFSSKGKSSANSLSFDLDYP